MGNVRDDCSPAGPDFGMCDPEPFDARIDALIDAARRWKTHSGGPMPTFHGDVTVEVVYPAGNTQKWRYPYNWGVNAETPNWANVLAWRYVV